MEQKPYATNESNWQEVIQGSAILANSEASWSRNSIEKDYNACLKTALEPKDVDNCYDTATDAWAKERESLYHDNLKGKSPYIKAALQNAEDQFKKFKEAQLNSDREVLDNVAMSPAYFRMVFERANFKIVAGKNPDDNKYLGGEIDCVKRAEDGVESRFSCFAANLARWDKQLDESYKELMELPSLTKSQKELVRKSQFEWVKYRDAQTHVRFYLESNPLIAYQPESTLQELTRLTRNRAHYLQDQAAARKDYTKGLAKH